VSTVKAPGNSIAQMLIMPRGRNWDLARLGAQMYTVVLSLDLFPQYLG
jgi:hypothetical protein